MHNKVKSWLSVGLALCFFLKGLEDFFFIGPSALLKTNIYFVNIGKKLKRSFRFDFDGFIKHFISEG